MSGHFPEMSDMSQASPMQRVRAGRPTREQSEQRHEELLDRALDMFLEKGYEQATIEAIAAAVGMTKRTVYARYEDKSALFKATVQRAIDRFVVPAEAIYAVESDDLETTLIELVRVQLAYLMTPVGIRLQRIINTESYRYPEIFIWAYEAGIYPAIAFLAGLLARYNAAGMADVDNPEKAAMAFMNMAVGGPARAIRAGGALDPAEMEEDIIFSVRLFLHGVLRR